ncbi:hypothetical protein MATL_G00084070 [Megalops atlanticus]|uniref:Uncharacterized protein n=1 Tax=Megalops atlanticus TaxID=7932 RepID=A0A9D3Q2D8_MEGAT|nr:hypothetical protein MATL_G00084070 [Megalops atlanticus]
MFYLWDLGAEGISGLIQANGTGQKVKFYDQGRRLRPACRARTRSEHAVRLCGRDRPLGSDERCLAELGVNSDGSAAGHVTVSAAG